MCMVPRYIVAFQSKHAYTLHHQNSLTFIDRSIKPFHVDVLRIEITACRLYITECSCIILPKPELKFNLIQWNLAATSEEEHCASLEDSEQISLQTFPADMTCTYLTCCFKSPVNLKIFFNKNSSPEFESSHILSSGNGVCTSCGSLSPPDLILSPSLIEYWLPCGF